LSSSAPEPNSHKDTNNFTNSSQPEHYDRVGATLRAASILTSASSLLFGFLLNTIIGSPAYFTLFDKVVSLVTLYTVAISSTLFIMPVIYQQAYYERLDVSRFLAKSKKFLLGGSLGLVVSFYMGLVLALDSHVPTPVAFILASFPFVIMIYFILQLRSTKLLLK
jgi:uncharacterized membrane-anchored protein